MKARVGAREPVEPATITGRAGGATAQRAASASAAARIRACVPAGPAAAA